MILQVLQNTQQVFSLSGTHFRVIDSAYPISVRFEGGILDQTVKLERGMSFQPDGGFNRVIIDSERNQKIDIEATKGNLQDNRISGEITTKKKVMDGLLIREIPLTQTIELIVLQSSKRLKLSLKNTGINEVRIGSQSDLLADSYPLSAGEKALFDVSASAGIYAMSLDGSTIAIIEEFETFENQIPTEYILDENGDAILDENGNYII